MKTLSYTQIDAMSIRQINAYFRSLDDSNQFPIFGRFNATERAIRNLRAVHKQGLVINSGLEYYLALEGEISEIVNNF